MSQHPNFQKYQKDWERFLSEAVKLPEYKLLTQRQYSNPRGYQKFEQVIQMVIAHIYSVYHLPWESLNSHLTISNALALIFQIAQTQAPIYWLSASLLETMLQTDLPKWIYGMKRPVQLGMLILPENTIYTPDREPVDYIAFRHTLAGEAPPSINFNNQRIEIAANKYDYITCATTTRSGTVYITNFGLQLSEEDDALNHGEPNFQSYDELGIQLDKDAENNFLRLMESIIVQTLLLMQLQPQIVTSGSSSHSAPGVGFGKSKQQKEPHEIWTPNWIGKDYRRRQTQVDATGTETHASLRPHWRRGHFRRVVVGKRELNQREWRWLEPVYVNASK